MSNRRDFIKISALGTAGVAVAGSAFSFAKGNALFASDASESVDDSVMKRG